MGQTVAQRIIAARMADDWREFALDGVAVRATDMAHSLNIAIPIEERAIFEHLARRPEGDGAASVSLYRYFHDSSLTGAIPKRRNRSTWADEYLIC